MADTGGATDQSTGPEHRAAAALRCSMFAHRLGVGTIWFGRPWPPKAEGYVRPGDDEVAAFLDTALALLGGAGEGEAEEGGLKLMVDTATAYGDCEERLGAYLRAHPAAQARMLVATKWGGSYERELAGAQPGFIPSLAQLQADFAASVARLGSVDLLYWHLPSSVPEAACLESLGNAKIRAHLNALRDSGQVRYLGASVSAAGAIRSCLAQGLFDGLDAVQVPACVCADDPSLLEGLARLDALVVLNSPVRKGQGRAPAQCIREALALHEEFVLLTGTRTHLADVVALAAADAASESTPAP